MVRRIAGRHPPSLMGVPESGTEEVDRFLPSLFRRTETSADQEFSLPLVPLGDLVDRLESQTTEEEDEHRASGLQDPEDGSHDQPQDLQ